MKYAITKLPLVTNHIGNTILMVGEESGDTTILSIKVEIHQSSGEENEFPFIFYIERFSTEITLQS